MGDTHRYQELLNELGWALCSVAAVIVGARYYCRAVIAQKFTLDDCFMVMALAAGFAMMALISAGVHHGYGIHLQDIQDPYDREKALMYTYVAPTVSIVASSLGKISMVLFLVHLLSQSIEKIHIWLLYSVTVIMVAGNIFTIGILLGGCMPMKKSWNPQMPGKCIDPRIFNYVGRTQSAWNAFMDLVTAAFPAYMVWRLQLKRSTKWSLASLMCAGLLAASVTFSKIWYMRDISRIVDITYAWAPISLCYITEVFVLIVAGSLPTLRPLFRYLCGDSSSENAVFAIFKKHNSQSTATSPYGGTRMAGTTGWELPVIEDGRTRDSSDDLTALPPYPPRHQGRNTPSPTPTVTSSEPQTRQSLGIITVQQDIDITYERFPKDSMSLESVDRR